MGALPVRLRGWDGSAAGPEGAPTVVLRDPQALRRPLYRPGELGLAQAYVTGELDVEGNLLEGFRRVWATARERDAAPRLGAGTALRGLLTLAGFGAVGAPPAPPASQARLRGRLHSLRRDRDAIAHHYDLSNDFYALILDEHMAYSCAYFTSETPGYTLEDAQRDKLDLVCRKLGLHEARPGHRHLDVGCGWGSLSLYAEQGLADRVEIRLQDYRDVADGPYDTVSAIEMGEHVGERNYPVFAAQLHRLLRPGGRALVQQMSRTTRPGGGPFIEAFIAPPHAHAPGRPHRRAARARRPRSPRRARPPRALRPDRRRLVRPFESNWDRVVDLVGEEVARVWRLYLVGGALAFEEGRMAWTRSSWRGPPTTAARTSRRSGHTERSWTTTGPPSRQRCP